MPDHFVLKVIFMIPILEVKRENPVKSFSLRFLQDFPSLLNYAPVGFSWFIRVSSPFRERWVEGSICFLLWKHGMAHGFLCITRKSTNRKEFFCEKILTKKSQSGFLKYKSEWIYITAWKPRRYIVKTFRQ